MNELHINSENTFSLEKLHHWYILHPDGKQVYTIYISGDSDNSSFAPVVLPMEDIRRNEEFLEFISHRPEGLLFNIVLSDFRNIKILSTIQDRIQLYKDLLYSTCLHRAWLTCIQSELTPAQASRRIDSACKQANKILSWLESTDFFTAPASTRFHDNYDGGLLDHSLSVCYHSLNLCKLPEFSSVNIGSAILVSLVHDWIKINYYEKYYKNVKNEAGQWVQEAAYKYAGSEPYPFGHGVGSMYMIQKMISLSMEEALAVRWHMGPWNMHTYESNELRTSNERYPLVHLLQFADQLSITKYC